MKFQCPKCLETFIIYSETLHRTLSFVAPEILVNRGSAVPLSIQNISVKYLESEVGDF